MNHAVTLRSHISKLRARLALVVHVVMLASVGFGLSSVLAAAGSAVTAPPAAAQQGPCGANPCGPAPAGGPCGANPCGEVPADQGPCGANPCGQLPADEGPCGANPCPQGAPSEGACGANPCAANPTGSPNTGQPAAPQAAPTTAPAAPSSTPPGKGPGGSTTTTAGGFQNGQAAPGLKISKDGGGNAAAWAIPVGLVIVVGVLFYWLVRRHRVEDDPSL